MTKRRKYGTGTITPVGYCLVRVKKGRRIGEHVRIAEVVLGKRLPLGAEVHHVDENKGNNVNGNLVICPSQSYHKLLHKRMNALKTCGHADWNKCRFCGQYGAPDVVTRPTNKYKADAHTACWQKYWRERYYVRFARGEYK